VPTRNQIVCTAGILQKPFFHLEHPQSVNYGGIGTIMGHELSQVFMTLDGNMIKMERYRNGGIIRLLKLIIMQLLV
jgi:putative endopeptidase